MQESGNVNLIVYDVTGKEIVILINNENYLPGLYQLDFNGKELSSGVYLYKLNINGKYNFSDVKRMILIK